MSKNDRPWTMRDQGTKQEIDVDLEAGLVFSPAGPGEERDPDDILSTIDPATAGQGRGFYYRGRWYVAELVKVENLEEWRARHGVTVTPPEERPNTRRSTWPPTVFYDPPIYDD